jgi:hypothetical protein
MYYYNIFYLVQERQTRRGWPHVKRMATQEPITTGRTNSTPGFQSDQVVVGLARQLAQDHQVTHIIMQAAIPLTK